MDRKTQEQQMAEWHKRREDQRKENLSYWCREAGPAGPMLWVFGAIVKALSK